MKILILGGKRFLGKALVEALLEAGHTPTLFNRGRTNPDIFPNVKTLIGDRDSDLDTLKQDTHLPCLTADEQILIYSQMLRH